MAKKYTCKAEDCGKAIPEERVWAALSRGKTPTYCSSECSNRQTSRDAYAKRVEQKHQR